MRLNRRTFVYIFMTSALILHVIWEWIWIVVCATGTPVFRALCSMHADECIADTFSAIYESTTDSNGNKRQTIASTTYRSRFGCAIPACVTRLVFYIVDDKYLHLYLFLFITNWQTVVDIFLAPQMRRFDSSWQTVWINCFRCGRPILKSKRP